MKQFLFVLTVLYSFNLFAQITVSSDPITFPQTFTSSADSLSIYLKNYEKKTAFIRIFNLKNIFVVSDLSLTIPSNDSILVWIKYKPNQNVIDKDLLFISSNDSTFGTIINLYGSGKFDDGYDATTFNLYDTQLKTALTQLVSNHYSLGYNLARDKMFMEIDNQKVNGQGATQNTLECVYTGRLAVGYTSRTDAQSTTYNFNTEHTWPQSNFNEQEPMKSDLYHLYPTDVTANSMRANYPFGKVVSNITWQNGGSKLGTNSLGQIVFEPRDVHKGNVSRSMFYFITRYPTNYGGFFTQTQESVFREWNKLDPVDAAESNRNNAIAVLQLKRNPFIDHPEFVDRIYSFATSNVRPVSADLNVLPSKVNFDSVSINNAASEQIYIANSGSGQLVIDSIKISDPGFTLNIDNLSIAPYSSEKSSLQFNPDSIKNYSATLKIYSNGGVKNVTLTGIGEDNTVNINDRIITPFVFSLNQNYPNPFNPSTNIQYTIGNRQFVSLKIYDVLGKEVAILVNEEKPAGSYEVEFYVAQDSRPAIASGIYFYRLQAGSYIETKKMILMK